MAARPDPPTSRTVPIKILRYVWETGWSGAPPTRPWADRRFTDVFQAANGWSVRDFWLRSTFGHIVIEFDIGPWGVLRECSQEALMDDRVGIIAACRRQAVEDRVPVAGYPHLVAFVHEPPADTGPSGGDLVLDQNVRSYRREIGHLINFGSDADNPYCVMGGGDSRAAGATLVRHSAGFRASAATVHVTPPAIVTLTALSEASWSDPVVALVPVNGGEVTFEYRVSSGDDAGVAPAVVAHSIGHRSPGGVWLETTLPPGEGADGTVLGVRATVLRASPTKVTVRLARQS